MLLESGNYLLKVLCNCNRRQNQLRHFALNGLFDVFRTSKGEKIAFPPPYPPCNVVPLLKLPLENKKHPNFEWRGQGRGVDSYASEVTLFEYNVSTILSPIVASPGQEDPSAECMFSRRSSSTKLALDGHHQCRSPKKTVLLVPHRFPSSLLCHQNSLSSQ